MPSSGQRSVQETRTSSPQSMPRRGRRRRFYVHVFVAIYRYGQI